MVKKNKFKILIGCFALATASATLWARYTPNREAREIAYIIDSLGEDWFQKVAADHFKFWEDHPDLAEQRAEIEDRMAILSVYLQAEGQ